MRTGFAGVGLALMPGGFRRMDVHAAPAAPGLSDPALQPKFVNLVPDALNPAFIYQPYNEKKSRYKIDVGVAVQQTGLVNAVGAPVSTTVWGYGDQNDKVYTWPGRTFQIQNLASGGSPTTMVTWNNELKKVTAHLLPVDTSLHWCYSLPGYTQYTIAVDGVPIVPHLHGGHTDYQFDGNPEFFFSPKQKIIGPQWAYVPKGFTTDFVYDNNVPAGNLWYHDHALGITRLNVYAGMAGFYFVRDQYDTGLPGNPLNLPAWPYEKAYGVQDRFFLATGELFYPAFPGDPAYEDFITDEGAVLPPALFPGGGPTALAEFFGDHMVVNGKIWPKENVEPRNYRMHLLNGCDSRFMVVQFFEVPAGATDFSSVISGPLDFTVIGSDQGLASSPTTTNTLLFEPGSRYDIIFDFKTVTFGNRVIMKNIGGDAPFGGDIPGEQEFDETDRIMAFDVALPLVTAVPDVSPTGIAFGPNVPTAPTRTRKVALFEGRDEFGRLQPLLGTAEPATDYMGMPINWPDAPVYVSAGLVGQVQGSLAWHNPTTENPALGSTEKWEIWNTTMDGHPIHLHLVHFEVLERRVIVWDSHTSEEERVIPNDDYATPAGDGAYLVVQPVVQHNGALGSGFRIAGIDGIDIAAWPLAAKPPEVVENTPKDIVVALPDQVTIIKAKFDKPGQYAWHCHILSHEDHEMMRVLHVGPMPAMAMKPVAQQAAPSAFSLAQNHPNPFNPTTTISFHLPVSETVELKIFNSLGQEVRTLANAKYPAGTHSVIWDGKSNGGRTVAGGMYIYRIKAGSFTTSKKMTLLR